MSNRGNPGQHQGRGRGGYEGRGRGGDRGSFGRGSPDSGRGRVFSGPQRGGARGGPPGIFRAGVPATLAPRLSPASQAALIQSLKGIEPNPERPPRPGFGTAGTVISVRANFFAVKGQCFQLTTNDFLTLQLTSSKRPLLRL